MNFINSVGILSFEGNKFFVASDFFPFIMDYIFDVFFEEVFLTLERSGLRTRRARTDVIDHLNGIIKGCSSGCEVPDDVAGQAAVVSAIEYHRRKKKENTAVCLMGKYHNILYIALRVCWDWGVKDSKVVSQLLEEIYSCEKTFERLFLGALFGTHAPYFIAGWRSDFKDQDENSRALVYFIDHARRSFLEFPVTMRNDEKIRQTRFIDVPITSCGAASPLRVALQASAPDILMILLRFGANPTPHDGGGMTPVMALLQKLIECENHRYPLQLRSCLTILLRTIPFIELPYKPHIYEVRREMFLCKYARLFNDKLLPANRVLGVAELKHLSRCVIRQRLRENCQLPNGIRGLQVPVHIRRYIDLMEE